MKADTIAHFVLTALTGSAGDIRNALDNVIDIERKAGRVGMAQRLEALKRRAPVRPQSSPSGLLRYIDPADSSDFYIEGVAGLLEDIRTTFEYREVLKARSIPTGVRLLLYGDPGNGKTMFASHVASKLGLRLYTAKISQIIQDMLGATARNLDKVFDEVSNAGECVFFIDEMDAMAAMRSASVTGRDSASAEMDRTLNALLLRMDDLPDRVLLIGATNRIGLLDEAIISRFSLQHHVSGPTDDGIDFLVDEINRKTSGALSGFDADSLKGVADHLSWRSLHHTLMHEARKSVITSLQNK